MSAYVIIHNAIVDPTKMEQYVPKAVETLAAHGCEILVVADQSTELEGKPPFPRTIVLKFASRQAALDWYNSPSYREVLPLRLSSTRGFAVLVDGVEANT